MFNLYLGGPITGLAYDETVNWRKQAEVELGDYYNILSPMRGKEYLRNEKTVSDSYPDIATSSDKGIFGRDVFDVDNANVILINFVGTTRVSIGSVMELAMAYKYGSNYRLVVMEKGNIHDHSFVREAASLVVDDLEYAYDILKGLASGYN